VVIVVLVTCTTRNCYHLNVDTACTSTGNKLIPWSKVPLEELIVAHLVKKLPTFSWNKNLINTPRNANILKLKNSGGEIFWNVTRRKKLVFLPHVIVRRLQHFTTKSHSTF